MKFASCKVYLIRKSLFKITPYSSDYGERRHSPPAFGYCSVEVEVIQSIEAAGNEVMLHPL